jgi:hypothetical protein
MGQVMKFRPKRQGCWHSGHAYLLSFLTRREFLDRVEFIKTRKPENERELRLRVFKQVKGRLPAAWSKAGAAWSKAALAALAAWEKAGAAWDKAYALALPALEALHAKECKNCPWDGETIFPEVKP